MDFFEQLMALPNWKPESIGDVFYVVGYGHSKQDVWEIVDIDPFEKMCYKCVRVGAVPDEQGKYDEVAFFSVSSFETYQRLGCVHQA